jgi:hypothetical protein
MEIGKDGYTHLLSPNEILMPKWFSLGFKLTKKHVSLYTNKGDAVPLT